MVLLIVLLVVGVVVAIAWSTRNDPMPPVRDSELPSTTPWGSPDGYPLDTQPGAARLPWVNTVPTDQMPLDQAEQRGPRR